MRGQRRASSGWLCAQPRSDKLSRRRAVARLWLLPGVSKCPLQSWLRHGLDGERHREGCNCRILVSYQFGGGAQGVRSQEMYNMGAVSLPHVLAQCPVASISMQFVNFPRYSGFDL